MKLNRDQLWEDISDILEVLEPFIERWGMTGFYTLFLYTLYRYDTLESAIAWLERNRWKIPTPKDEF
jgi:hypothetical protein